MQVGGPARYFAEPATEEELLEILDFARHEDMPYFILGKGSNVIFPDAGYPGLVVSLLQFEKNRLEADQENQTVTASGGTHLYRLALFCRDVGLSGVEFLSGIPGTVGGAVVMNAGFSRHTGQHNEIGDIIEEVTVLNTQGKKEVRSRKVLSFGYRSSNLTGCIILEAKLRVWKRDTQAIEGEMNRNFEYRNHEQDLKHPSSGSIFKNPAAPAPSAGRLIDSLGLKETQVGGIMVSPRHANYFIKVGPAKSSDVTELIHKIQQTVFDATQVFLEPEVRIVQLP